VSGSQESFASLYYCVLSVLQAIAWTTTILAASFVLDYLARLWTPIAALRPISLFHYYLRSPASAAACRLHRSPCSPR